jgi:hypothetical protein
MINPVNRINVTQKIILWEKEIKSQNEEKL